MNYRQLTRKLRRLDCVQDRQAGGSHEVWVNVRTDATATIPNWRGKDLKPGTIAAILRDLGISREDFEQA